MFRAPVVVTGIGIVCAAGRNVESFSASLWRGESGLREIMHPDFAPFASSVGGEISGDEWDTATPASVDPAWYGRVARLAIQAISEALERARVDLSTIDPYQMGLVVGKCQGESMGADGWYMPMHAPCDAVAHLFGICGARIVVSTACAAGTNALGIAADLLRQGDLEIAIAGGSDVLKAATYAGFNSAQAISRGATAPYSRSDGLNLGEGAAFLVLERENDALTRGAVPLAEILGYGSSEDAYHATAPDPTGKGAASAMLRALSDAGIGPEAVDYVNGHGTGTPANDAMERRVMRRIFGPRTPKIPISSTKSFVGHTLGAAGAIEAVACILAINNDMVPPTLNFVGDSRPDRDGFDFVPNTARRHLVHVAVSNNYAFGGVNASIVLAKPHSVPRRISQGTGRRVFVTGLGPVGPLGVGLMEWRKAFTGGISGVRPIASFDARGYPCQVAGEMCELDGRSFAPPGEWRHMNGITRQVVASVRLGCEDASLKLGRAEREGMGLVLGTGFGPASAGMSFDAGGASGASVAAFSRVTLNAPGGEVCRVMGFRGPTTTVTTGAVSGTLAISLGCQMIKTGRADVVVVVAADEFFEHWLAVRCRDPEGVSRSGTARPYDNARDGAVLGGAAVALVLEAEEGVERRGANVYCEILSVHHVSDTFDRRALDPAGPGFLHAITGALNRADHAAADVGYLAGWASGGRDDVIEAGALSSVFGTDVPVSAPKSFTGECEAASGAIGVMACSLALSEGLLPPTLNLVDPMVDPALDHIKLQARSARATVAVAVDAAPGANYAAVVLGREAQ